MGDRNDSQAVPSPAKRDISCTIDRVIGIPSLGPQKREEDTAADDTS